MFETESFAIMFFFKYSYLKKLDDQASVASDFDSWRNIMNWSFICSIYRTHQKINTIIYDHTHHENQSFWTIFLERLTVSDTSQDSQARNWKGLQDSFHVWQILAQNVLALQDPVGLFKPLPERPAPIDAMSWAAAKIGSRTRFSK